MPNLPPPQLSERRLSAVDVFCMQTYPKDGGLSIMRVVASTLGFVCMMLIVLCGIAVWRGDAIAQQRDALAQELRTERAARLRANLAVDRVEMKVAGDVLDTRVRRDIVDERMGQQERRSAELEQLAKEVEREKLIEADCITPQSILAAAGL